MLSISNAYFLVIYKLLKNISIIENTTEINRGSKLTRNLWNTI